MTITTTNKQMTADEIVAEMIKAQKAATKHLMMTVGKLPWSREAVVAGGAPRDWYCNRPASDIDIFLIGTTITRMQLELDMKLAGFDIKPATKGDRYSDPDYGYGNPALKWVYDGVIDWRLSVHDKGARPIKFQIIVTTFPDLAALLGSFAVEISKFTFDHVTGKITGHGGAVKDMTEKTVTQTGVDYKRGKAYVKKICAKFPDHRFVDMMPPSPANAATAKLTAKQQPMNRQPLTSDQFVFWLQGFFEMTNPRTINEQQTAMIKDHLALVFDKVTPHRDTEVEISQPRLVSC